MKLLLCSIAMTGVVRKSWGPVASIKYGIFSYSHLFCLCAKLLAQDLTFSSRLLIFCDKNPPKVFVSFRFAVFDAEKNILND